MAKASLTLPGGTVVSINGSPEEIARLMQLYGSSQPPAQVRDKPNPSAKKKGMKHLESSTAKKGARYFVAELLEQGFFAQKKSIVDLQRKLEEEGHIYAQTSLSGPLLHFVVAKRLRRFKEKDMWLYINR